MNEILNGAIGISLGCALVVLFYAGLAARQSTPLLAAGFTIAAGACVALALALFGLTTCV